MGRTQADGYVMSKRTMIWLNICASLFHYELLCMLYIHVDGICYDPVSFDDPESFHPECFLASDFGTKKDADETGRCQNLVFGCGWVRYSRYTYAHGVLTSILQRICPGMELAINSPVGLLFLVCVATDTKGIQKINTMNLLWGFNFTHTKDPNTRQETP